MKYDSFNDLSLFARCECGLMARFRKEEINYEDGRLIIIPPYRCNQCEDIHSTIENTIENQLEFDKIIEQLQPSHDKDIIERMRQYQERQNWKFAKDKSADKNENNNLPETLIDQYRNEYTESLNIINKEVTKLINNGREMQGIMLFSENLARIVKVNESLGMIYSFVFDCQPVLKRYRSQRLIKLGHEPIALFEQAKKQLAGTAMNNEIAIENMVIKKLRDFGYTKTHPLINDRILLEIDYMLDVLRILVEPEFVPLETSTLLSDSEQPDRYIPSQVKITVWRRDYGRCVECGSQERLEYDHIIPFSKGGSNTERNIQLLCEKCNRKKCAFIK